MEGFTTKFELNYRSTLHGCGAELRRLPVTIDPVKAVSAFKSQRGELSTTIIHNDLITNIANKLFVKYIIPKKTFEEAINTSLSKTDRTVALLNAIEARIEVQPSDFTKFVDILDSESYFSTLIERLVHSYNSSSIPKSRSTFPPSSSGDMSYDVREFSENLSSEDLYRYLLFKHVPRKDCDIIKEEGISGLCFLDLSNKDWKDYRLSRAGIITVAKLQERIKAAQIEPFISPHVSDQAESPVDNLPASPKRKSDEYNEIDENGKKAMQQLHSTPVEKMELTRESGILYKKTVRSNGHDKEEVSLGKDFTAEKNITLSLKTLLNELVPVRKKWREICIQLNIPYKKLQDFVLHDDPLTEGLNYWLDGNTDVPITWGSIVEVLASHHVEEYVLAEILREKFSKESYKKTNIWRISVMIILMIILVVGVTVFLYINLNSKAGETIESALFVASQNGQVEEAKSLLERGAQINFQTNDGTSALHIASQNGHVDVAKLLLEKGAKVDLLNNDQCSPLMIACEHESTDVARVLLDHDADTYLRNKKGQRALEIAKEKNHVNIILLFAELKEKAAYPGILFSEGVKKEFITSDEKTINLEDVGISITFPENSWPSSDPPLEITIQPCFSGPFEMPDGIESVSPAYIIKYNRKITFIKDVILKIRHNANLQTKEDCENMVFLSARSTPEYRGSCPFYVFKEITDTKGLFGPRQEKPLGEIQLKHFCIVTTGIRKPLNELGGNSSKLYSARLFRTKESAIFCMCLYQPLYMQQCENAIVSKYTGTQGPIDYNCVTLSSKEVAIRASENNEWRVTFQKTKISRTEIEIQEVYQNNLKDLLKLNYPPRIDIGVTLTPVTPNPTSLELHVEGLNEDCTFNLHPDHYVTELSSPQVLQSTQVQQLFPITDKNDLFEATKEIGDWFGLCTNLRVSEAVMNGLKETDGKDSHKKQDCLTSYFNKYSSLWNEVVRVIAKSMDNERLACKIARKHMKWKEKHCELAFNSPRTEL